MVAGAQGVTEISPLGRAIALGLMALSLVQAQPPPREPYVVASLLLFAAGLLIEWESFPLTAILVALGHLLLVIFFLRHVRRRRWFIPLGLAALAYTIAALAVLLLWSWPGWVAPTLVLAGFILAVVAAAAASNLRWAALGAAVSALGHLVAATRVRDWPDASISNDTTWTLFFTGTAIMVASAIRGPVAPAPRG